MGDKFLKVDVGFCSIFVHKDDPGISKALRAFSPDRTRWPREPEFMEICLQEICADDVILDIGANIGFMTAFFSTLINGQTIYAVEPAPKNIEILEKNVRHLGIGNQVEITAGAFSDQDGTAFLELSTASNLHALFGNSGGDRISVNTFNLSSFLGTRKAPNFIKMDVEGAEVEILEGFKAYVGSTDHKLKILIEIHPNYYSKDRDFCAQLAWYCENGFNIKKLISATIAEPHQIIARGYKPNKVYSQGGYSRGIYESVSVDHAIDFIQNTKEILFSPPNKLNKILGILGLPLKTAKTNKIVRGILLERS